MVLGDLDSYMKKMKLNHQLTPYTKINSKWIKDLNISHDAIKVLEENIGRKISDIPHSNIFTDMSPRARHIKERINKWYLIKIFQSFNLIKNKQTNHDIKEYETKIKIQNNNGLTRNIVINIIKNKYNTLRIFLKDWEFQ